MEVETPEKLANFRELIEILTEIKSKVEGFDPDGRLERLAEDSSDRYNYKLVSMKPSYQRLGSYEHGSIEDLDDPEQRSKVLRILNRLHRNIAHIANDPYMPTKDKVAIYHAFLQIQAEFEKHGDALNDVIAALETTLGLHQGIKNGFPLELQQLLSEPLSGELGLIVAKLATFEADHLIPALEQVTSREGLAALEPLVHQCIELGYYVMEATADETFNQTHNAMVELYNAKFYKTRKMYVRLMAYNPGTISRNPPPEKREAMAASVNEYIQAARHCLSHPLFSTEEKEALYETILTIQNELREFGEEDLLDPAVCALGEELSISEPERPKAKKGVFAFWEEQTSGSVSRETQLKRPSRIQREGVSPEIHQGQCIQRLQLGLANLDLDSPFLKDEISDLKREIKTLQRLSSDPVRFAHLETALNTLLKPTSLAISAEESVFMTLLGKKCGLNDLQLADYQLEEDVTVREGLSALLGKLQAAIGSPESHDAMACDTLQTVTANVKQERFRCFTDLHALPALGQNFILHYPALVQTFELYSREIVVEHLEETWGQIEEYYNSQSDGRFSELLVHYSYMDPCQFFPGFVEICQEKFFRSLTLKKIDRLELGELEPYLTRKIKACKTHTATLFQTNYEDYFLERHNWLVHNFDKVTMPYNQGDHDNTNLEAGVCYNNCFYRMSLLM